jgi:hypothetical protein
MRSTADIEPAWSYMLGQIVVLVPAMIIGFVYALHRTLTHKIANTPLRLLAAAILAYVALFDLKIRLFASESLPLIPCGCCDGHRDLERLSRRGESVAGLCFRRHGRVADVCFGDDQGGPVAVV